MKISTISLKSIFYILIIYFINFQSNTYSLASKPNTIKIYEGLHNPKKTIINVNSLNERPISLHFLLPTIGRKSIFNMLHSLKKQLQPQDYITVIFDAKDQNRVFNKVKAKLAQFPCKTNLIFEEKNLGYWGHNIRNKYNALPGDFVLHCDDDNTYTNNSLSMIRKICSDPTKLYIFRIQVNSKILWTTPGIKISCIDTSNGVIPTSYNTLSSWKPRYGGDYDFYCTLSQNIPPANITFVDFVIHKIRQKRSLKYNLEHENY